MIDQIIQRLTRMVRFDHTVYREIATDDEATMHAVLIVVLTALLSAIGIGIGSRSILSFLLTLIIRVPLGWLIWSGLVYLVGTQLFAGQGTFWNIARVLGYATAPTALSFFAILPCLGALIGLVGSILALVLGFFAIRETMELTTEKTILTILIGWVVSLVLGLFLL